MTCCTEAGLRNSGCNRFRSRLAPSLNKPYFRSQPRAFVQVDAQDPAKTRHFARHCRVLAAKTDSIEGGYGDGSTAKWQE